MVPRVKDNNPRHVKDRLGPPGKLYVAAVIWPRYCRYGVKHYIIIQSMTNTMTCAMNLEAWTWYLPNHLVLAKILLRGTGTLAPSTYLHDCVRSHGVR